MGNDKTDLVIADETLVQRAIVLLDDSAKREVVDDDLAKINALYVEQLMLFRTVCESRDMEAMGAHLERSLTPNNNTLGAPAPDPDPVRPAFETTQAEVQIVAAVRDELHRRHDAVRDARRTSVRYWINTVLAVAAVLISVVALVVSTMKSSGAG